MLRFAMFLPRNEFVFVFKFEFYELTHEDFLNIPCLDFPAAVWTEVVLKIVDIHLSAALAKG